MIDFVQLLRQYLAQKLPQGDPLWRLLFVVSTSAVKLHMLKMWRSRKQTMEVPSPPPTVALLMGHICLLLIFLGCRQAEYK